MHTVSALQSENLWTNNLRRDVVNQTISAALRFDKKFGSVLADHRLYFRYQPSIWNPVFFLIQNLDWFKLSYAPSDDVDKITFQTVSYDLDGYDFCPTKMERMLGAMLPRKLKESSLIITEHGPESVDFDFDRDPISEVNKLSLDVALDCDFVPLVSDKIQKRNIYKWLMRLLEPEAVLIISMMYLNDDKTPTCCPVLKLPRIAKNRKAQEKALNRCGACRSSWRQFDFHPKAMLRIPECLLWEATFYGLKTLVLTANDDIPAFMNAPVQNENGFIKSNGVYTFVTGKGIHSVYLLDEDFGLVKSTARAGVTMAKLSCLLRLISKIRNVDGSVTISPKTDFRVDAAEWLDLFIFKNNLRALALLESAAESLSTLVRFMSESNWDYHPHLADFQKKYFIDFKLRYCIKCTDPSCPVNEALDSFIEKMGRLLQLKDNRTITLEDVLDYDAVETFVVRNFDKADATKVWKSTSTHRGFEKALLFDYSIDATGSKPAK